MSDGIVSSFANSRRRFTQAVQGAGTPIGSSNAFHPSSAAAVHSRAVARGAHTSLSFNA
jgi:hypothetical protein